MKNRILNEQKKPAKILLRLQEARSALEKAGEERADEKSKRWQANFDYAYAQVRARLAYIYEYNTALGNVKLEKLPELEWIGLKDTEVGWFARTKLKLKHSKLQIET